MNIYILPIYQIYYQTFEQYAASNVGRICLEHYKCHFIGDEFSAL